MCMIFFNEGGEGLAGDVENWRGHHPTKGAISLCHGSLDGSDGLQIVAGAASLAWVKR